MRKTRIRISGNCGNPVRGRAVCRGFNSAKSKYKAGQPPKEQTVTIAEAGPNLDVTIKGTAADGSPIATHYTVPAAGGDGKVIE